MADFYSQAKQQYDPSYNQKVQGLKNTLAQNQNNLETQKSGINANYNTQVANQNLTNKYNKNNYSNTMLGRGMANSSIVGTGLAEQDSKNARLVGEINNARTGSLNDIDRQKAILAQNMNATLGQMQADREDAIWALARQLEDRQRDYDYKQSGLQLQREGQAMTRDYQNAQLALSRENAGATRAMQERQMALEERKYNDARSDQQAQYDPDTILATAQSYLYDPKLSDAEKYNLLNSINTQYKNKIGGNYSGLLQQYADQMNTSRKIGTSGSGAWQGLGDSDYFNKTKYKLW